MSKFITAAALLVCIVAALVRWNVKTPTGWDWDESNYLNRVLDDAELGRQGGLPRLARTFLFDDVGRPPAYRILAHPVARLAPGVRSLRTLATIGFLIVCGLLWLTVRSRSSAAVASLMTMLFASAPGVLNCFTWFGTEPPLFIAIALQCWCSVHPTMRRTTRIALYTIAIGLGLLSKATFLIVGIPLAALGILFLRERRLEIAAGSAIGAILAWPWWYWNWAPALDYARQGRTFMRAAIERPTLLGMIAAKIGVYVFETVGPFVLIAIIILIAIAIRRRTFTKEALVLGATSLLLPAVASLSPVFFPRHIAPSLLPLVAATGIALGDLALREWAVTAGLAIAQTLVILIGAFTPASLKAPLVATLRPTPHIDWWFVTSAVPPNGSIAFIGAAPELTPPQLELSARLHGRRITAIWLWRAEETPAVIDALVAKALGSDIVLSVDPEHPPQHSDPFAGRDNQYVPSFLTKLEATGRFAPPVRIRAGGAELLLFRKS